MNNLRSLAFWSMDKLRGQPVRKHFLEIKDAVENPHSPATLETRASALNHLLTHATGSTTYYRGLRCNLSNFPIVDKAKIKANIDDFISSKFTPESLHSVVTSGSTGTPFMVYHDKNKRFRSSADTIYFASRAGFRVGDELLYLKIWSASNQKSKIDAILQNVVAFDVLNFNDPEIERFLNVLLRGKHKRGILGYASSLELIIKYMDRKGMQPLRDLHLSSAISMSESLSDYTKAGFKKYFDINLFARYSNLENGILAQQFESTSNRYLVNTASYIVEIFKLNEDLPAAPGEIGRIVITDLYNFGMPMIRYDTGDIGRLYVEPDGKVNGNILDHIEGRKLDLLFNTSGELVSSYIMYKNMWKYTEILQYQLVQTGLKSYIFKINADNGFNRERELVSEFKHYLGDDADFQVEYVSEIPLLSSGKRKKIVNTYYTSL
jgi:phenylacetate-CoA ligase